MKIEWKDFETRLTLKQIIVIQLITMTFFFATEDCFRRGHISYLFQQQEEREENYKLEREIEISELSRTVHESDQQITNRVNLLSEVLEFSQTKGGN